MLELMILAYLNQGPQYGYQLMERLKRFAGWNPDRWRRARAATRRGSYSWCLIRTGRKLLMRSGRGAR